MAYLVLMWLDNGVAIVLFWATLATLSSNVVDCVEVVISSIVNFSRAIK